MILASRQWQVVTSIITLVEKLQTSSDDYIQTTTTIKSGVGYMDQRMPLRIK